MRSNQPMRGTRPNTAWLAPLPPSVARIHPPPASDRTRTRATPWPRMEDRFRGATRTPHSEGCGSCACSSFVNKLATPTLIRPNWRSIGLGRHTQTGRGIRDRRPDSKHQRRPRPNDLPWLAAPSARRMLAPKPVANRMAHTFSTHVWNRWGFVRALVYSTPRVRSP